MNVEAILLTIGFTGLILGLMFPKIFANVFGEGSSRPIIVLVFGAIILTGAFWNESGSTAAIGYTCVIGMIIGLINPSVFKPMLNKLATRPVIFSIFFLGLIIALLLHSSLVKDSKPDIALEQAAEIDVVKQQFEQIRSQINTTRKLIHEGKYDQALTEAEEHLQRTELENNPELKAEAIRLKADVLFNKADYNAAKSEFEAAVKIYRNLQIWEQEAWCLYYLGLLQFNQNEYGAAIANFVLAEDIYKKHDQFFNMALTRGRLGDCYRLDNQHTKAITYYRSARDLFNKVNSLDNIAWVNSYWAESLDKTDKTLDAINKITAAIDYYKTQTNHAYTGWCYERLADYKLKQGDKANAVYNYIFALEYYKRTDDTKKVEALEAKIKEFK